VGSFEDFRNFFLSGSGRKCSPLSSHQSDADQQGQNLRPLSRLSPTYISEQLRFATNLLSKFNMSIDRRKATLFGAAAAVRLLLFTSFPSLPELLTARVEISTPVTSFKRCEEKPRSII
jgi:hypothetical protein